jgi:predicted dehydrogenase
MNTLKWGLIGGGKGSQIGPAHRLGARLDGYFQFAAGALDHRPDEGKQFGIDLGLDPNRSYGSWQEMLAGERDRDDRVDLVTVATPNNSHFEITKAFLSEGFHVLCEKPLTMTVEESLELAHLSETTGTICAVNYGYSGYSLVRHMKAMVSRGDIGKVRMVFAEFAHGHHADATDADNPRIRWRYDPAQIGVSAQFADCGIHALHLATFITDQRVKSVSADTVSLIPSRQLEDDAMVNFRMTNGIVGRLWTSACAIGRQHGLAIQVFGETGGLRWTQEQPNQLYYTPVGGRTTVIERGEADLSPEADKSSRVTIGHAEGMPLAFANIYAELHSVITEDLENGQSAGTSLLPLAIDGAESIKAIYAVAKSGQANGEWVEIN